MTFTLFARPLKYRWVRRVVDNVVGAGITIDNLPSADFMEFVLDMEDKVGSAGQTVMRFNNDAAAVYAQNGAGGQNEINLFNSNPQATDRAIVHAKIWNKPNNPDSAIHGMNQSVRCREATLSRS